MHVAAVHLLLSVQLNRDFGFGKELCYLLFLLPLGKMLVKRAVSEPL